jgi:Rieske Fe-S protein
MSLTRRELTIRTCAALAAGTTRTCGGCAESENLPPRLHPAAVDAGPVGDYAKEGVYDQFKDQGVFIIRKGERLYAISSICTHRTCKLKVESDHHTLHCRCHGSSFDDTGKVLEGPATRNLPELPTSVDSANHLHVHASVL